MLTINENITQMLDRPARSIKGRVELYNGSTLVQIFNSTDLLKSFTVERQGTNGKFFGFGISHKVTAKVLDSTRSLNIEKGNRIEAELGASADYVYFSPFYNVAEVTRDENTNELTITAHDTLQTAAEHTVNELGLPAEGYTLRDVVIYIAAFLGLPYAIVNVTDDVFNTYYPGGANLDGTETIRAVLDMVAEVTQTIYFIGNNWELTFKRLDREGAAVFSIDKSKYFTLSSKTTATLTAVTHCTELGDNVTASIEGNGSTQYVRNNAFWDMRDDIGTLVDNAIAAIGGISINQFECTWRGNFALEIGDKVELVTKDNGAVNGFILSDTISYTGAMSQTTKWQEGDTTGTTASNPSNLGEALKQTYAKVDKVNKQIEMVASETADNSEELASLRINTNRIDTSVKNLESKVNATMTAEQVEIKIEEALENEVTKVTTETGFTFDKEGLTVSKSGSEMSTQITEDGMQVFKDDSAVLTADNSGVSAQNLHATTYIIIGANSRFETYEDNRTACFWIGG